MTETEARNEMIGISNVSAYNIDIMINLLSKMYSKRYPNFAKIYQSQLYDLEEYFKNKEMSCYNNNLVSSLVLQHFCTLYFKCADLISIIAQNIKDMPSNKIFYKAVLFLNKKYVTEYEKLCSEMANFSLQNNIESVIIDSFKNLKFYYYMPNEITRKYNEIKETLAKAELKVENLDNKVRPYIQKYEKETKALCELVKQEIKTDNEVEIKNYIKNMVEEVKQEISGKQKHI